MTRYFVILAAVLIGSVVGPVTYDPYDGYGSDPVCDVKGDGGPAGGDDECKLFEALKFTNLDLSDTDEGDPHYPAILTIISDNADNCKIDRCSDDCDCHGLTHDSCDRKCYLGCQRSVKRYHGSLHDGQNMIMGNADDKWINKHCELTREAWLDGAESCDPPGTCGVCSVQWCAHLKVKGATASPGSGMCERGVETWHKHYRSREYESVCTKNIRASCNNDGDQNTLLASKCAGGCGIPVDCGCGLSRTWAPLNDESTDFTDPEFCDNMGGDFWLTQGACVPDSHPLQCDDGLNVDNYGQIRPDVKILSWNVLRLPKTMCDGYCGMEESRFKWGHCASPIDDPAHDDDYCFAVVDNIGMDIGTCELDRANASVYDCATRRNLCCPEEEDYVAPVQKKVIEYKTETVYKTKDYPEDPEDTYPLYDEADPGSASTYTVLSVAGIALAHAML